MCAAAAVAVLLAAATIAACGIGSASDTGYQVSAPRGTTTVLPGEAAAELALSTSRALYDRAPVAVLAGADDFAAQASGASAAVSLGAPLLLVMSPDDRSGQLSAELERLEAESVLAFGPEPVRWAEALSEEVEVIRAATGRDHPDDSSPGGQTPGDGAAEQDESNTARLTAYEPSRALGSLTVLATRGRAAVAATATARAAGARVIVLAHSDPRTDSDAIAALSEDPPDSVVALGDDFGDAERLRRRLEVAATGVELPGGGQVLFPHRRIVAVYGHPETPALGALGDQPRDETLRRAKRMASEYEPHSDVPVIPALEIIATIASQDSGEYRDYSIITPVEELRPWIDAAREAGVYVALDLQPGRTDFLTQARRYEELLTEPHVGLALDPEWRLRADQAHLAQIGSVDAQEINDVIVWLADLTREHELPQKLVILHQFELAMISNRDRVDTSHDELAVLLHADGHGTPELKRSTWNTLTEAEAPSDVWWGWKNFYDEDHPTWTPGLTMEMHPSLYFVSYQ